MSLPANFKRAKLYRKDAGAFAALEVDFNPEKLQFALSNTFQPQGPARTQYVTQSNAKLSLELVFDTTGDGSDVHAKTMELAGLMEPNESHTPPVVVFDWGAFVFSGIIDSYQETLDFFSAEGVPLRATVSLTLSRQEKVFEREPNPDSRSQPPEPVLMPGGDATALAGLAGDPRFGRTLAALNGMASMRFAAGPVAVSAGISLQPPIAFASGGTGFSIGGGAGLSVGGGLGAAVGGGAGLTAGISGGVGLGGEAGAGAAVAFGGGASAGVTASAGAFAGLRAPSGARVSSTLDTSRLLPPSESVDLATDAGASFSLSGQARTDPSASLRADVGASATLQPRLRFEGG